MHCTLAVPIGFLFMDHEDANKGQDMSRSKSTKLVFEKKKKSFLE